MEQYARDIDKGDYPASLPVIAGKLRPGGVLIIDNMFWCLPVTNDQLQFLFVRRIARRFFAAQRLDTGHHILREKTQHFQSQRVIENRPGL
jgi:predicted O-methyltransferase YrrM